MNTFAPEAAISDRFAESLEVASGLRRSLAGGLTVAPEILFTLSPAILGDLLKTLGLSPNTRYEAELVLTGKQNGTIPATPTPEQVDQLVQASTASGQKAPEAEPTVEKQVEDRFLADPATADPACVAPVQRAAGEPANSIKACQFYIVDGETIVPDTNKSPGPEGLNRIERKATGTNLVGLGLRGKAEPVLQVANGSITYDRGDKKLTLTGDFFAKQPSDVAAKRLFSGSFELIDSRLTSQKLNDKGASFNDDNRYRSEFFQFAYEQLDFVGDNQNNKLMAVVAPQFKYEVPIPGTSTKLPLQFAIPTKIGSAELKPRISFDPTKVALSGFNFSLGQELAFKVGPLGIQAKNLSAELATDPFKLILGGKVKLGLSTAGKKITFDSDFVRNKADLTQDNFISIQGSRIDAVGKLKFKGPLLPGLIEVEDFSVDINTLNGKYDFKGKLARKDSGGVGLTNRKKWLG